MIVAQLASIPERASVLERVIASIIHQVDEIRLNIAIDVDDELAVRHNLPGYLIDPKIYISYHDNSLQDGAKFINAPDEPGYNVIVIDDDIEYPHDFVERMTYSERMTPGIISCMGKTMKARPIKSYFKDEHLCLKTFEEVTGTFIVEIPGTCAMFYRTSKIIITASDMKSPNSDICVGVLAKQKEVKCYVRPHDADWLTNLTSLIPNSPNMFDRYKNDDSVLTKYINKYL